MLTEKNFILRICKEQKKVLEIFLDFCIKCPWDSSSKAMNRVHPKRTFMPKRNVTHPWEKDSGQPILSNAFLTLPDAGCQCRFLQCPPFCGAPPPTLSGGRRACGFGTALTGDAGVSSVKAAACTRGGSAAVLNSAFLSLVDLPGSPVWRKKKKRKILIFLLPCIHAGKSIKNEPW